MSTGRFIVNDSQRKAIAIALVIALVGGALFLKPYFSLCVVAIIFAFLFSPVYKRLLKRSGNPGRSSMLTFLFACLVIIIPATFVIYFSVKQIDSLIDSADFVALNESIGKFIDTFNQFLKNTSIHIEAAQITAQIESALKSLGQSIVSGLPAVFSGFLAFITSSIIFIYVFLSLLKHNKKLLGLVRTLNPLGEEISNLYISKMSSMTKATVRGQFIIAFCQGLESAIVLSIAGMSDLFFFFLVLLTALSIIPMGAGIITIPLGIILILSGDVWQGALIILNHLLIVTNIDNVLRPRLVPRDARLDPALMILAVFAGVAYFGFMGIVLGPVIMIVIVTTIEVYLEVYRDVDTKKHEEPKKKRKGLFGIFRSSEPSSASKKQSPQKAKA